jgi:hypothetical protein
MKSKGNTIKKVFKFILLIHNYTEIHNLAEYSTLVNTYTSPLETRDVKKLNRVIKNMFGEDVGYYYVWVSHYIKWLIFPAILGLLLYMADIFIFYDDSIVFLYLNIIFGAVVMLGANFYMVSWKSKEDVYRYI